MKLIAVTLFFLALTLAFATAYGHGTSDIPIAPTNLTDEAIVHRLRQLAYTHLTILRASEDSVNVELQRNGQQYTLTVSKRLTVPDNLAGSDVAKVVERGLKPVGSPAPR